MDVPKYLQVLWRSKWFLLVGAVVAAIAAFFAGFTIIDGKVTSRAVQSYTAATTLLVAGESDNMYQAVVPGQPLVEGQTQPETVDLTSKAILYAYLISGLDMRGEVEDQIGVFSDDESLTALRRTTQPGGDESFPGRYVLPILSVVGTSLNPDRAEEIADTAADLFLAQVVAEQDAATLPDSDRVVVSVLDRAPATEVEGSNPAIPIVITFLGVFLLFVAAAFILAGVRAGRSKRNRPTPSGGPAAPEPDAEDAEHVDADSGELFDPLADAPLGAPVDPSPDGDRVRSRRGARETAPVEEPDPAYTG
ncbi:hypothetical protein [Microbacterium trichothecenolyticum]|uniref:Capsular polysaccharide biosynthesis protein n=1 Tax=Microbacterium trichothecenolyticum TaxID=69370 RepID=A0A0M2H8Q0_MICTR|nr:hypothetical protein [Microbacterium trichothecenolyticum]KJL40341.1 hypothetical protein RS82_03670 [Microbacterium trichothecenolyticum]